MSLPDPRIQQAKLAALFRPARQSALFNSLAALLLTYFLAARQPWAELLVWNLALHSANFCRGFLLPSKRIPLESLPLAQGMRYFHIFLVCSFITASLWGASFWLFFPGDDWLALTFMVIVLVGVGSGATIQMSAQEKAYLIYVPALAVPVAIRLLLEGTQVHLGLPQIEWVA